MKIYMAAVLAALLLILAGTSDAQESPKSVFVMASCDGEIGSSVVSSLRDQIRGSHGYQLVSRLDEDGGRGVVLTIYISCTESKSAGMAAVAKIYGEGRCVLGSCHVNSYESTLGSLLCSSTAAVECGRRVYTDFDDYWSGADAPPL